MEKTDFYDLVERIKDSFMEIDSEIMVDLKKQDEEYVDMCQELGEMESRYPFILEVTEGSGAISLTAKEHEIVRQYMRERDDRTLPDLFPGAYGRICVSEKDWGSVEERRFFVCFWRFTFREK